MVICVVILWWVFLSLFGNISVEICSCRVSGGVASGYWAMIMAEVLDIVKFLLGKNGTTNGKL